MFQFPDHPNQYLLIIKHSDNIFSEDGLYLATRSLEVDVDIVVKDNHIFLNSVPAESDNTVLKLSSNVELSDSITELEEGQVIDLLEKQDLDVHIFASFKPSSTCENCQTLLVNVFLTESGENSTPITKVTEFTIEQTEGSVVLENVRRYLHSKYKSAQNWWNTLSSETQLYLLSFFGLISALLCFVALPLSVYLTFLGRKKRQRQPIYLTDHEPIHHDEKAPLNQSNV